MTGLKSLAPRFAGFALLAALPAFAAPCATTTLDVYIASGFTCQVGNVQASNFQWSSDFTGLSGDALNLPAAITVTPTTGVNTVGFQFSNLALSTTFSFHVLAEAVSFNVNALSGTIVGASETLGTHSATGAGTATAYFQDSGSVFLLTLADPLIGLPLLPSAYDTIRTTQSTTFPGVTSLSLFSGTGAITGNAASTVGIGAYSVSLTTSAGVTAVPEPASMTLLAIGAGLSALLARARRRI